MRKIDDHLLLEMYAGGKGKPQVEIAKFFECSRAAICKRLKRLLAPSPEVPASFSKLTERQQGFVVAKVRGETNVQAVTSAYEVTTRTSAKAMGTKLMADPDIQVAISDLLAQEGLTKRYRIRKVKRLIDHPDGNISAKGLDLSYKLEGAFLSDKAIPPASTFLDLSSYNVVIREEREAIGQNIIEVEAENKVDGQAETEDSEKGD